MARTFAALLCGASIAWAQSGEFGAWRPLFNGKDTSGWIIAKGANRGKAPARWSVADGALTNGKGGVDDICTAESFENYELEIEYMIPPGGNSGVYLRGQIEIQVHDSGEEPGKHGVGAIYALYEPRSNPQKPAGQWNQFRIRQIGHRITVWHNGVLVQDNVYVDRKTGGAMGEDPATGEALTLTRGPIMLQGDHSPVSYRAARIRPLFAGEGWRPLWTFETNGEDLSPFDGRGAVMGEDWKVDDHAVGNKGRRRDMWTREAFGNFLAHYEYRSDPNVAGGNSGFYLRDQWEIQILSRSRTEGRGAKNSDGALYDIYPPEKAARHDPECWNHMDVKLDGMRIWVWQNGAPIHDGKVCKTRTDSLSTPTLEWSKKPFKFQGDHGDVWFTNLYVKPLPDTP